MKRWLQSIGIVVALALVLPAEARAAAAPKAAPKPAATPPDALTVMQQSERFLDDLTERVRPAVVNVRRFTKDDAWWSVSKPEARGTTGWRVVPMNDLLYPGHRPSTGASGFLISADGYIMTLRRVVLDPRTGEAAPIVSVEVELDQYKAAVVAMEPTLDLAILKIESKSPLPFLRFADSGKARPGHWAVAYGNPDASEQTLVPGVVSFQPTRECYQDDLSATYMQTSVTVGDGALGGPVVNLRGEVIGVSARRGGPTMADPLAPLPSSGYALPSNIAYGIFQGLLIHESKESPWLGIAVVALTPEQRTKLGDGKPGGILIDNVFDPSPAAEAGVRVGDILKSMEGERINDVYDFQRLVYHHGAGSRVRMGLVRDKKPLELTATITRRPPEATTR